MVAELRCWLQAAGCWLLAAGCWLLAAGCWLLAAGVSASDSVSVSVSVSLSRYQCQYQHQYPYRSSSTPNLRPLHSGRYSAILFDEGNWSLCFHNKKMMQASSRPVELGQSQCNDRSYSCLLFRVPLIVCSNNFWEGCNDPAAREWIELNSIYIRVDKEVWQKGVVS